MLRVALTGGIATGKSYVLGRLASLGAACLDADLLARGVMAPGTEGAEAIVRRFGPAVLQAGGEIDRRALASMVFDDAAARRDLEAIVHPAVYRAMEAALRALARGGDVPVAVVEIPLLYETGQAGRFDRVIATVCGPDLQVKRLVERGLTPDEARRRLEAQMPAAEKAARADFVVQTGGTREDTDRQVREIWRQFA